MDPSKPEPERARGEKDMEHIQQGYRGLSLLVDLNWDRLLYVGTIAFALSAGAFIGSMIG